MKPPPPFKPEQWIWEDRTNKPGVARSLWRFHADDDLVLTHEWSPGEGWALEYINAWDGDADEVHVGTPVELHAAFIAWLLTES